MNAFFVQKNDLPLKQMILQSGPQVKAEPDVQQMKVSVIPFKSSGYVCTHCESSSECFKLKALSRFEESDSL